MSIIKARIMLRLLSWGMENNLLIQSHRNACHFHIDEVARDSVVAREINKDKFKWREQ